MSAAVTLRPVAAGDLDRGGGHPASHIQHPVRSGDLRPGQQRLGGRSPAGVDHPFANDGHELVRVQIGDLSRRELGCHRALP
jgi:hypothetical protein